MQEEELNSAEKRKTKPNSQIRNEEQIQEESRSCCATWHDISMQLLRIHQKAHSSESNGYQTARSSPALCFVGHHQLGPNCFKIGRGRPSSPLINQGSNTPRTARTAGYVFPWFRNGIPMPQVIGCRAGMSHSRIRQCKICEALYTSHPGVREPEKGAW